MLICWPTTNGRYWMLPLRLVDDRRSPEWRNQLEPLAMIAERTYHRGKTPIVEIFFYIPHLATEARCFVSGRCPFSLPMRAEHAGVFRRRWLHVDAAQHFVAVKHNTLHYLRLGSRRIDPAQASRRRCWCETRPVPVAVLLWSKIVFIRRSIFLRVPGR